MAAARGNRSNADVASLAPPVTGRRVVSRATPDSRADRGLLPARSGRLPEQTYPADGPRCQTFAFSDECRRSDVESPCDSDNVPEAEVPAATLDAADVRLIEFAQFGEVLLGQALPKP